MSNDLLILNSTDHSDCIKRYEFGRYAKVHGQIAPKDIPNSVSGHPSQVDKW